MILQQEFAGHHRSLGLEPGRGRVRAGKSKAQPGPSNRPPRGRAEDLDRAYAAVDRLDSAWAAFNSLADSVPPPSETDDEGVDAALDEAQDEVHRAEDELTDSIRKAAGDATDGQSVHSFRHRDGRVFITLPEGEELEMGNRVKHVLEVAPHRHVESGTT